MSIAIDGGYFINVDLGPNIEITGGLVVISDSFVGDVLISSGSLYISNSIVGDITLASELGNGLRAVNVNCTDLTLNGGAGFQDVRVNGLESQVGTVTVSGAFRRLHLAGLSLGTTTSNGPTHTFTDVTNFYVQATVMRSAQEGFRFDGCVAGDAYLTVLNSGGQTDNTYDGIDLVDCDRLNLFGSVRGAVDIANNPRYGIDIPSGNLLIDVWMQINGYQTGAINDGTGGQVTVH